jgi:hypothetical protein
MTNRTSNDKPREDSPRTTEAFIRRSQRVNAGLGRLVQAIDSIGVEPQPARRVARALVER